VKYNSFIFKNYVFDAQQKTLQIHYSYDNKLDFTEIYTFDFEFVQYSPEALDQAIQTLFFMAGVSYYKAFMAPDIQIQKGLVSTADAEFYSHTYQKGLGEFFYVNQIDPQTSIKFPVNAPPENGQPTANSGHGMLIGLGGGKDSLVSVEILRGQPRVATWSLGHKKQLTPLVQKVGLPHFWVDRKWDEKLLSLNAQGAYNGHVPISAILAAAGSVVAILSGYQDVVVSNENSANEPTLNYQGVDINHQYSKSLEFEQSYQAQLSTKFGQSLRYYSLLRPFSELFIAKQFVHTGFEKYKDVFSSCNKAFTHNSPGMYWDGTCPKCAFVFLALTPFVGKEQLQQLFSGNNLLKNPQLQATYNQLLGIAGDKPLECVGEIQESRAAMRLAQGIYPELSKYVFELPQGYDYTAQAQHSMPPDVNSIVGARLMP